MDALYWQLHYPGGRVVTESPANVSIRAADKGAESLLLVRPDGTAVQRVPLRDEHGSWLPIWYRRRGVGVRTDGRPGTGTLLDGTVYGRARDRDDRIDVQLWAAYGGKLEQPLPPSWVDHPMIQIQVLREDVPCAG